jgi:rfaE bifunctional protein nucleotidyltransferase chain/domain
MGNVVQQNELMEIRDRLKREGKRVVFTNGCFDLLHRGHADYLQKARALGDVLVVGVNSDASVSRIKGRNRPIVSQDDRAQLIASLASVDYVCLFEEDTPHELLKSLVPDILVKGADWAVEDVVGKEIVEAAGGSVRTIELLPGRSTTHLIETIVKRFSHS